jgi:hypothetical protein
MRPRRRGEAGSVLMLVPAGILVLLVLGAIAVDSAVVFLAQRDLANRTAAAANDIAGAAVSDEAFYTGGGAIVVPEGVADAFVDVSFSAARRPAGFESWDADATTAGRSVTVSAEAEVRYLFAPAVPGVARTTTVRARSTAVAVGG